MHFPFVVEEGTFDVACELRKPLTHVTATCNPHWGSMSVTLWRADGSGLWISSELHDVAFRMEIGNLRFRIVAEVETSDTLFSVVTCPLLIGQTGWSSLTKLTIEESGSTAEAGAILEDDTGGKITILAGASPYGVATLGISPALDKFIPEYPLEMYRREAM